MSSQLQVVVLAAGKGVRFKSQLPKVLHPVCGLSILERVLRAVGGLSPKRVVVVVGHAEALVRSELEKIQKHPLLQKTKFEIAVQTEQKGTGHAVQMSLPHLDPQVEKVLILPGDVPLISTPVLQQAIQSAESKHAKVAFLTVKLENPSGYGRVFRASSGAAKAIVEEKDCSPELKRIQEINSSIYCVDQAFLKSALVQIRPENAQKEFYLTDVVRIAAEGGLGVEAVLLSDSLPVMGCNSRTELLGLELMRRKQIAEHWMNEGVSIEDPQSTFIEEDVVLSPDCVIGSGARLKGRTKLHSGVTVEGGGLIIDSEIGAGCRIRLGSYIESSEVGPACDIGPYAHLRPGSVLERGVQVGNFAEVKNSRLGEGSKSHHFSYLGDSDIGSGVNIGAGTVTCNYDGKRKHRTTIEAGAFVGTNSSLVAPLTIGQGAYVAAGSVITKNVPAEALAVERSEQVTIAGWASRQKAKSTKSS